MNKAAVKSSSVKEQGITPLYFYGAIALGVIVLCVIAWKVYTAHSATMDDATIAAHQAAKKTQQSTFH